MGFESNANAESLKLLGENAVVFGKKFLQMDFELDVCLVKGTFTRGFDGYYYYYFF